MLSVVTLAVAIGAPLVAILGQGAFRDGHPTLHILTEAFQRPGLPRVIRNTVIVVFASAVLAVLVGTPLALAATKLDVRWRRLFRSIPLVPLTIAPLVGTIGWIFLLAPRTGWLNIALRWVTGGPTGPLNIFGLLGVVWVTTLYTVPFVFTAMFAALERVSSDAFEAYLVNGTGRIGAVVRMITGPLRPALVAGFILAMLEALVQFSIPLLLNVHVLTTQIFDDVQQGFPPRRDLAGALSLAVLAFGVALSGAELAILGRRRFTSAGGKGLAQRHWTLGRRTDRLLEAVGIIYLLVSAVLPLAAILLVSLLPYWTPRFKLSDLTLRNYAGMFRSPNLRDALANSLELAGLGCLAVALISLAVSLVQTRSRSRLGKLLYLVGNLPFGIPDIVLGLGLLIVFSSGPVGLYGSLTALFLAYVIRFLPYGLRNVGPAVSQVAPELEEAARIAGSNRIRVLTDVTIPMVLPAVTGAAAIAFVVMLREYPMSALLSTPTHQVVSVYLVDNYENGVFGSVAVLAIGLSAVSFAGVTIFQIINSRVRMASTRKRNGRPLRNEPGRSSSAATNRESVETEAPNVPVG